MDFAYIKTLMPALLEGTAESLKIFVWTLIISLPLGLPIALASISRFGPVRAVAKTYTWIFRGTPLMLQLFLFFYFIPVVLPFKMDRIPTAIITFALNYAAYFAEIYRAGIESVDSGQHEAAKSLGFSKLKTMRLIIIPQAIRSIIPPVNNEVITLVKDTALVYVIGVPELMKAARDANNRDSNPTAYLIAALIYLALTFVITIVAQKVETKFSQHTKKETAN